MTGFDLDAYIAPRRKRIEAALEELLPPETQPPATLHRGMRYAVLGQGKRIRPLLSIAAAEWTANHSPDSALRLGCAVELVHAYSLVHDDLPSMDDDDFRRGRPTTHRIFGEAGAILIGDALLTLAFDVCAACPANDRFHGGDFAVTLARAAGDRGMVAGQFADIEAERTEPTAQIVRFIHENKTARLFACAVELGAMAAGAADSALDALRTYGLKIGLAFQIVDDLLDATGDPESLGKAAGMDTARGKATWPVVAGLERSRRDADSLLEQALTALAASGEAAQPLRALGRWIVQRDR